MIFIGDVHGKIAPLLRFLDTVPEDEFVIQLGDMGLGFPGIVLPHITKPSFKFIRGNHDDPALCRKHPNYLGEYGYIAEERLFYISGAWSIDWMYRVPGVSWWEEEQLSKTQLSEALTLFSSTKPEIVVSHDCPTFAAELLLRGLSSGYFDAKAECQSSITCLMMQKMLEAHAPKHWFFGHYHVNKDFELGGTQFHCRAELAPYKLGS